MSGVFATFPDYLKDLFLADQKAISTSMFVLDGKVVDGISVNYSVNAEKTLVMMPKYDQNNVIETLTYQHVKDNVSKDYVIKNLEDLLFLIFEIGKDELSKNGMIFNSENDFREVFIKEFIKRKWLKKEYHYRTNDKLFFEELMKRQSNESDEKNVSTKPSKDVKNQSMTENKNDSSKLFDTINNNEIEDPSF